MPFNDPQPVGYDQSQNTAGQACTGYTLSAPASGGGPPGTPSDPFGLALKPVGCMTNLQLVITPHATDLGGNPVTATFSPATVTLSQANPNGQFTMTSAYANKMLISCTHTESVASGGGPNPMPNG